MSAICLGSWDLTCSGYAQGKEKNNENVSMWQHETTQRRCCEVLTRQKMFSLELQGWPGPLFLAFFPRKQKIAHFQWYVTSLYSASYFILLRSTETSMFLFWDFEKCTRTPPHRIPSGRSHLKEGNMTITSHIKQLSLTAFRPLFS